MTRTHYHIMIAVLLTAVLYLVILNTVGYWHHWGITSALQAVGIHVYEDGSFAIGQFGGCLLGAWCSLP